MKEQKSMEEGKGNTKIRGQKLEDVNYPSRNGKERQIQMLGDPANCLEKARNWREETMHIHEGKVKRESL